MNEIEISSIFHEVFLIISYLAGLFFSILVGMQNKVRPVVTALMILMATLFYLFFYHYFVSYAGEWHELLRAGFPHIDKSVGMTGIMFGLILSGLFLRVPLSVLYQFSFPVLIIYAISNLGCLGGNCTEVHSGFFHFDSYLHLFQNRSNLLTVVLQDLPRFQILFKIISGFGIAAVLYSFRDRFRNPSNIFLTALSAILLISFVNQIFMQPVSGNSVFSRLLGLNIFQWAILMATFLILTHVFNNESTRNHRNPRLRVKSPSAYRFLILYGSVLLIAFHDSDWISKTNPSLFFIGFSFSTFLLVLYFHQKIRLSAIRYATILIILIAGIFFLQSRFFNPENENPETLKDIPEKGLDKRQVILLKKIRQPFPD